jgi:acyl carrier protein
MEDVTISVGERIGVVVQRLMNERSISRPVFTDEALMETGLTSLDAVRLVLLVEDEFDFTIPLGELTLANFRSISTISRMVVRLLNQA